VQYADDFMFILVSGRAYARDLRLSVVLPCDVCRLVTDASVHVEKSQLAAIRSEIAMLESSGKRGHGLKLVYRYLLSIPPSSVDAERTFSAAGVLCTKVGSQLSDQSIDTLCFLRSYYQKNKQ